MSPSRRLVVALSGVVSLALGAGGMYLVGPAMGATTDADHLRKAPPSELRLERSARAYPLSGVVEVDGVPLDFATVTVGTESVMTDDTGAFLFNHVPLGTITVSRPGYDDLEYDFDGSVSEVDLAMTPRIIRALHISSSWAIDNAEMTRLIDLANKTTVNAFVFDANGDDGFIDYETKVPAAVTHKMITDKPYDIEKRLQQAKDADLYTIMRVTTFANPLYVKYYPKHSLGGGFLDPGNKEAWEYPLAIATEVCEMGFDEISFDYIRYPSNFFAKTPKTVEGRVANIQGFLTEAAHRLHPLGCAISASSFGGPTMSTTDYGIGQRVEEFTIAIDAYAPMTYPDLWAAGDFGLAQPWNHPKEVVSAQLDSAMPRMAEGTVMRPWLRASWYPDSWILVQIKVAEDRGLGWMMWNSYDDPMRVSSFPAGGPGEG